MGYLNSSNPIENLVEVLLKGIKNELFLIKNPYRKKSFERNCIESFHSNQKHTSALSLHS